MKHGAEKKQKTRYIYDRKETRNIVTIIVFVIWFWIFVLDKFVFQ